MGTGHAGGGRWRGIESIGGKLCEADFEGWGEFRRRGGGV